MKKIFLLILLLIVAAVSLRLSLYTVDAAEYAYVTVLGQHVATHDGTDNENGAGLHVGWPWPIQTVTRLDRRLQLFDLPEREHLTRDRETVDKRLLAEAFVCWRIPDSQAVDVFVRRIGTPDHARAILSARINSELGAAFGQMRMDDLISTKSDPKTGRLRVDETVETLRRQLLANLGDAFRSEYGIELVDIRLRRFNHPKSVRESIFARIRSERQKKVTEHRSEGEFQARKIRSDNDEAVSAMLAKARADEERIKGQADAEAMTIRNQAHSQDPEFYGFLKQMERLQSILGDNKTVLLLSTHRALFERLFTPPRPDARPAPDRKTEPVDRPKEGQP